MKCTLKKRIVALLCVWLLFCTPHTIAYATAGDIESTIPEKPTTRENAEQTSYSVEIAWDSLAFDYVPLWNSDVQATVNLALTSDPMDWEIQQYNQIGSIKTEFTPLPEQNPKEEAQTAPHIESGAPPQEEP